MNVSKCETKVSNDWSGGMIKKLIKDKTKITCSVVEVTEDFSYPKSFATNNDSCYKDCKTRIS